ncbi:alkaline phosphatase D family protein [Comamonas sp. Y33R10-2]|uniref:alkaline phosphatase D family protein n=1 Tax=Comamonas sp. Y33R10-2 TaxID=2853257 RepID=UPI001C5CB416|nr:alkaline phosphatase D family protein [Comamonas sp. Y33R10-2]QXZ08348.1 alkaline phosphatase D family protein [Comamonas sp. Y33R10-2]
MSLLNQLPTLQRRRFLIASSFATAAGSLPAWARSSNEPGFNPFGLGVASGDVQSDNILIWTRVAVPPSSPDEANTAQPAFKLRWEVAHDDNFRQIVASGDTLAQPEWGHSVRLEVKGLAPDRWYFYRFMLGSAVSTTGRCRTAPLPHADVRKLRLAVASCQRWEHGFYTAWADAAQAAPDMVLFLGDYIYEYAQPEKTEGLARPQPLPTARTLQDYRNRYALHKSDAHLQAAHAVCNWSVIWDDHEVENDYVAQYGRGESALFLARRMAAWQAFYENMPLRPSALQRNQQLALYRTLNWGRLARMHMLDGRQYRDLQACRPEGKASTGTVDPQACTALHDPARSFLGWDQERWLDQQLKADSQNNTEATRWSLLVQTTLFSARKHPNGKPSTDSWDGYPEARQRLVNQIRQSQPRNSVVLGGDIHQNYVCAIGRQADQAPDKANPVIASEFCGTSISSHSGTTQAKVDAIIASNPQVLYARCEERGYSLVEITPQTMSTELRAVTNPLQASSSVYSLARFAVEDRKPGPVKIHG